MQGRNGLRNSLPEAGSAVATVLPGQFVVGSFFASDSTCEICRAGYQTSCIDREVLGTSDAAQSQRMRVPLADGTLVATPEVPDADRAARGDGRLKSGRSAVRPRPCPPPFLTSGSPMRRVVETLHTAGTGGRGSPRSIEPSVTRGSWALSVPGSSRPWCQAGGTFWLRRNTLAGS